MKRHALTDEAWAQIAPLRPGKWAASRGHEVRNRLMGAVATRIVWILVPARLGRDLPQRSGPWQIVYNAVFRALDRGKA